MTSALSSLAELQETTQQEFTITINNLSRDISQASRPSSKGKSDLYVWRQIFQLWVEAQIFESTREKDRGERDIKETEARLSGFANEVVKRGLGDRRTMKTKESRAALERFLQVNVLLLDLKKVCSRIRYQKATSCAYLPSICTVPASKRRGRTEDPQETRETYGSNDSAHDTTTDLANARIHLAERADFR